MSQERPTSDPVELAKRYLTACRITSSEDTTGAELARAVLVLAEERDRCERAYAEVTAKRGELLFDRGKMIDERDALHADLAACREALNEACDLAVEHAAYTKRDVLLDRIAELRAIAGGGTQ